MHQKRLAAGLRPDPLGGSLSAPQEPLAEVGEENWNLNPQFGAHCGGGEKWKCVEWAEMNEKGISKPDIVSHFRFRSKCMFDAELRKEPIERA